MEDDNTLEDLVRRLTPLGVKLDERDDPIMALLDEQREFNREQREFNRSQVAINAQLHTLMTEVFRDRHNGRDA